MSLLQWNKFWQRKKVSQRQQNRSHRLTCEPLESRKMLTLVGVIPTFPIIAYDSNGHIAYSPAADTFDLTATPLSYKGVSGPPRAITPLRDMQIHILVDNSGNLIGGTPGDDLEISGTVDLDGNPLTLANNYSGVLLTGEINQFGFSEGGTTDQYDFRFIPTGGALAYLWAGKDIGITTNSENSTFNNDFTVPFDGGAKGNIGTIPQLPGHIIVDKITNPGGDPTSFNFSTTGTGYAGFSLTDTAAPNNQQVTPGTYSVAELVPAGWDLTGLTIVDPTGDSTSSGSTATLVVGSGETIHVTYNDTARGHIIVDKITDPSGDPASFSFSATGAGYSGFSLTDADTPNSQELTPGTYSIAELVPAGWSLASIAIVDPSGDSTSVGNAATLTLAAGETIVVTYTDTKLGHIVVDKVTNPSGDPTSFSFSATGAGYAGFGLTDAAAPNDQALLPGTYSIAELVPAGWNLASIAIVDPSGDSTSVGNAATLTLAAGETIVVTYTDTKLGHIVVDKVTNPSGDPTSFTFNTTGTGYSGFGLTDAAAPNNQELVPGTYTVSELVPAGWTLASLTIVDPSGGSSKSGATATLSLAAGETILVTFCDTQTLGSIAGTKYTDVTGNGLTPDDTPLGGVTIYLDTNNDGVKNSGEPSTTTLPNGTYAFTGLAAGIYTVREIVPTGFVRTAPTLSDKYTVNLAAGAASTGNNFANAEKCDQNILFNVVYVINGTTVVSDLRDNTNEGDTVEVSFTIAAGHEPHRFTLVSYTAPGSTFVASQAYLQSIFDVDTGVFGPGTHTLTVTIPHSFYQVDFVCGSAIDHFGPEGSNIFYSAQSRLLSADNDGMNAVLANGSSLSGVAYIDANNNGTIEINERVASGSIIKLTGTTTGGSSVSQSSITDTNGQYLFDNLKPGTYTITETQPGQYTDGADSLGSLGGTKQNDKFTGIVVGSGVTGINYNFGEKEVTGSAVAGNQTATIAYWNASNGQNLIKALNGSSSSTNLSAWLVSNFGNIYGSSAGSNNLTGKTNAQIASFYQGLFATASKKLDAETLALALAVYVTKSSLAGGNYGASYGFGVSADGLGIATVNVGGTGAAFGVDENAVLTVMDLLYRTNQRAKNGVLWDANGNGLSSAENVLRAEALTLFDTINNT